MYRITRNAYKRSWLKSVQSFSTRRLSSKKFPAECDAVIIGGGSIGCSTLYHLTKLGMRNVVLLEKHKLTCGTTWHTAGLVWSLRPNDIEIQLLQITRDMLNRLESETGIDPGWQNVGGLFLASTKERLDEYKRLHTIGKPFGIESHVLGPEESGNIYPLLDKSTVYGTLYSPADGHVDPSSLCNSLTKYATMQGAQVIEGCSVSDITTEDSLLGSKKITGVETRDGFIKTNVVINCTGAWSPSICKMIGVDIPLIPMKHSYVLFDKIEGVSKGLPNMRDHDGSVYFRVHGNTLAIGGYEPDPILLDKVEQDFSFGLYELDWDVFGKHIEVATARIPRLKDIGIKSTICGPESFTPDHKPIMGEDPNIRGFYHGCGFNSAGMMMGGGCGSQLAKWVFSGEPDHDMFGYDIRRFSPKLCANKIWAKERSHEAYASNYNIVYKHDEPLAGRNQFLGPLHGTLTEQGCFFQERQGWERPGYFLGVGNPCPVQPYDFYGQYGHERNEDISYKDALICDYTFEVPSHYKTIEAEALACRNACTVFDMSYFGKFFLIGPDATEAAQYIFSNDLAKPLGSVVYTCMLNHNGGIEADLTVTVMNESLRLNEDPEFQGPAFYLAVGGTTAFYTFSRILSVLRARKFDCRLIDQSEEFGMMSIQGPRSRKILSELFNVSEDQFSNEKFPFSTHQILNVDGTDVRVMRVSFVGEMGWELHVPKDKCFKVYHHTFEVGKPYGIVNAGYRAIDSLSTEKGYRHWHADIRSDDTPLESGLAFTCKLKTDIDFLGRKALVSQKTTRKLNKRLFCFTLDGVVGKLPQPLFGLETIWDDSLGKPVGYLRRAEYGYSLQKGIGYGYIHQNMVKTVNLRDTSRILEHDYSLEIMGNKVPAAIHTKSPFDPNNLRIQGVYKS